MPRGCMSRRIQGRPPQLTSSSFVTPCTMRGRDAREASRERAGAKTPLQRAWVGLGDVNTNVWWASGGGEGHEPGPKPGWVEGGQVFPTLSLYPNRVVEPVLLIRNVLRVIESGYRKKTRGDVLS